MVLGLSTRTLTIDGARIRYVDEGRGPPVVLLHGAPITALGFLRVIRGLAGHYRVIAPDLPGFGGSERAPGFGGTLESYADFVEKFCGALALERFYLYVNDASGAFGLAAAARMKARVAGLVVASTVQTPLCGAAWIVKLTLKYVVASRLVRFLNRRFNLFAWLVATVAPWLKPFAKNERRVLIGEFDTVEKRERIIDLFEHMGRDETFMHHAAQLAREHLGQKPAMILYGQLDPVRLIGGARYYRRLFPNSVVKIVRGEEHFPILASGEKVAALMHAWIAQEEAR